MAKFNLNDYEQVDERIKKFLKDHPNGRILTDVIFQDGTRTMVKAFIYEDEKDIIKATGIAEEIRIVTKAVSSQGREYEEVNYSSWTENAETSAIGRALANAGYSGNKRASREEMEKVNRYSNIPSSHKLNNEHYGRLEMATDKQSAMIKKLKPDIDDATLSQFTKKQASSFIAKLMGGTNENAN